MTKVYMGLGEAIRVSYIPDQYKTQELHQAYDALQAQKELLEERMSKLEAFMKTIYRGPENA